MAMTRLCEQCGVEVSVSPGAKMIHYANYCRKAVEVPPEVTNLCTWEADDDGIWNPLCDQDEKNQFCFTDEGPEKNGFKFCPFCGRPMVEVKPAE